MPKTDWVIDGDWDEYQCVTYKTEISWIADDGSPVKVRLLIANELNTDWRVCRGQVVCGDRSYSYSSSQSLASVIAWSAEKLAELGHSIPFMELMP